jgi:hypothetical protein
MKVLVLLLVIAGIGAWPRGAAGQTPPAPTMYFCPMHPDVTDKAPASCSRCGMKLVPGDPWNEREYLLDVKVNPAAPVAGARARLTVLHPESKTPVRDFAVVHDKRFHLFVISQDLEDFAHIHPEQEEDGSWTIEHTLARPGYYRLSDCRPASPAAAAAPASGPGCQPSPWPVVCVPASLMARRAGCRRRSMR